MTPGPETAPADIWHTDPVTLRDVVLDCDATETRLTQRLALERVWILGLLDHTQEAIKERRELLDTSTDRLRPLLVLAQAYQRQYSWHEAARLQEEALRLAHTRAREALVRRQIRRRLFDEARYREAAAEFEWVRDLYRTTGHREQLVHACQQTMDRARELNSLLGIRLPSSGPYFYKPSWAHVATAPRADLMTYHRLAVSSSTALASHAAPPALQVPLPLQGTVRRPSSPGRCRWQRLRATSRRG